MFDDILHRNERLRQRLAALTAAEQETTVPSSPTIIITAAEVNQRHGTGVLVSRIFGDTPNVVSMRTRSLYGAEQNFGAASFCLPQKELSRAEIFFIVHRWLTGATARRIVCVPYYPEDLLVALAAKELFDAPLCTYIMDDHNIYGRAIPDALMEEALKKSDLRLAISTEMQHAYQDKYRLKFWLLPPVVSDELLLSEAAPVAFNVGDASSGVLVGNIWGQRWLNLLRETVRGSGTKLHWYSNSGLQVPSWLKVNIEELARDGIFIHEALPEAALAEVLRKSSFAVVPSGTLDETDDNVGIARLSLPTRIPFILASSNTPIIVIGSERTASARFVKRFQVGTVCDYEPARYREAVARVTAPAAQTSLRETARAVAQAFAAKGTAEWVWKSLEQGEPSDMKYEKLMALPRDEFAFYVEPQVPKAVPVDFAQTFRALRRLKSKGFRPDFVIDIGASTGVWSQVVSLLFPRARFILVDAVASKYDEASRVYQSPGHEAFEMVEAALSDKPGRASFQVSSDLYNSSLLKVNEIVRLDEVVEVEVTTLDHLAQSKAIAGRGLLKMDVQYAEHRIVEGGSEFIGKQVDAIIMELTLMRPVAEARTFLEMVTMMDKLGFRYYDDTGEWRRPTDGTLEQKDVLFVRQDLFVES